VFFAVDSHLLSSEALAQLARQVAWLRRNPNASILVAGNCDERGTREYNLALGARRADSVRAVLIAHGIIPGRIRTVSYGRERPLDPGSGEASWARNRNAQTIVIDLGPR
jgi:peptidoglycan-associated lipoprotein